MQQKKELKIEYQNLICRGCTHPIIWRSSDMKGAKKEELEHINLEQYGSTKIITLSKDCWCGCMKAVD
jgi:hypothetical protein